MSSIKKRRGRRWLLIFPALALILAIAFGVFVSDYYRADEAALEALQTSGDVRVEATDYGWRFDGPGEDAALVFYPGAKVEAASYAPFLRRLAAAGVDACLVEMPFRLAFFDIRAVERVMAAHDYRRWYVGGHSLGGMLAANYAADHPENLDGVVLCAAYPITALPGKLAEISVYGTMDRVLNMSNYEKGREYAPPDFVERAIDGGNHAGFGHYGPQKGDGEATISADEQQAEAAGLIAETILNTDEP